MKIVYLWKSWTSRLQNVSAQCIVRINREAITKIQKKYPYGCGSHSGQYVLVIEKSLMSTTNLKDHVNVSDENLPGLCHLLLSSSFFSRKTNSVLTQLGKKHRVKDSQYFQMNGKTSLKRMFKNRMNIRRCFIKCLLKNQISKNIKIFKL